MVFRAAIFAFFLITNPIFGWEVRLYDVRPDLVLPRSGPVAQPVFDQARSASPLAVFHLSEGETASIRLLAPDEAFEVQITPRPTGGISFSLTATEFHDRAPIKGASEIHHVEDYLYLLRPLPERPVLIQFIP